MAKLSKDRINAGLSTAARVLMRAALNRVKAYYSPVLAVWHLATPGQKEKYLANSPLLKELIEWVSLWQR